MSALQWTEQLLPQFTMPPPQLLETWQLITHPAAMEQSIPDEHAVALVQLITQCIPGGQVTLPPALSITHVGPEHVPPTAAHAVPHELGPPSSVLKPMRPHAAITSNPIRTRHRTT
jgi:hypothetical protein